MDVALGREKSFSSSFTKDQGSPGFVNEDEEKYEDADDSEHTPLPIDPRAELTSTFAMHDPKSSDASLTTLNFDISREPVPSDPGANPFRLVVDPVMRLRLRRALSDLIESHDQELARYVSDGSLNLDSYKEYIELFARSLRDTVSSRDGVAYLLEACGFRVDKESINLSPQTRWRVQRETPAAPPQP